MKTTTILRALSLLLCLVLLAAAVSVAAGCSSSNQTPEVSVQESAPVVKGEGATVFTFKVTYKDGKTDAFEIHTDEKTVGDALLKAGLIEGDTSEYGLYVKKVNGVTADYATDGTYWAFYVDGAYASTGVDSTDAVAGAEYAFKVEK